MTTNKQQLKTSPEETEKRTTQPIFSTFKFDLTVKYNADNMFLKGLKLFTLCVTYSKVNSKMFVFVDNPAFMSILSSSNNSFKDLNGCLLNCSNNGQCIQDSDLVYKCNCFENFKGKSCGTDLRPCNYKPCLNGAKCVHIFDQITGIIGFKCDCDHFYYGSYCENKLDFCHNEKCSYHGNCQVFNGNNTKCVCHYLYDGDKCQNESQGLKIIKNIINLSSIIAIIIIILFYLFFIFLDLTDIFIYREKGKKRF